MRPRPHKARRQRRREGQNLQQQTRSPRENISRATDMPLSYASLLSSQWLPKYQGIHLELAASSRLISTYATRQATSDSCHNTDKKTGSFHLTYTTISIWSVLLFYLFIIQSYNTFSGQIWGATLAARSNAHDTPKRRAGARQQTAHAQDPTLILTRKTVLCEGRKEA